MLDPQIQFLIDEQNKLGGIEVSKLKPGTKLKVQTHNSTYLFEIPQDGDKRVWVQGGKFFPEKKLVYFGGSTWGGSMLKIGWIGKGMHMEFGGITTSAVQAASLYGEAWEYPLEW